MKSSVQLSAGQEEVLRLFQQNKNVFMTGPGGSGKSTLVKEMYSMAMANNRKIQVTALTGCAAVLLGCRARTIHSFAGIGLGAGTIQENLEKIVRNTKKVRAWRLLDILIIDEVSMMSKKLLEMLDAVARRCRSCPDKAFGGLQVIFSGDFYQIRPIGNVGEPDTTAFCFESPIWEELFPRAHHVILEKIFRQSDPKYANILNRIRDGSIDDSTIQEMIAHSRRTLPENSLFRPTKLFATRKQVEDVNRIELEKLPADREQAYAIKEHLDLPITQKDAEKNASFTDQEKKNELQYLSRNLMCDANLRLRPGCQVMCIVNKDVELASGQKRFLCNGSQGVVVDFLSNGYPVVRFNKMEEDIVMEPHVWQSEVIPGLGLSQIPLLLAWALTIHKAQGSSMESAEIDVGSSIFECGQTYVALSRIKSMEGLYLKSFDPQSIYINPRVREFYQQLLHEKKK